MRLAILICFVATFLVLPFFPVLPQGEAFGDLPFALPSAEHLFGTDYLGRGLLTEIVRAGQTTLVVSLSSTAIGFAIGLGLAVLTALFDGLAMSAVARAIDALIAIPSLIIAFVLVAILGSDIADLIIVITVVEFCRVFRSLRAPVTQIVAQPYVHMSRVRGEGFTYIVVHDVWPNLRGYAAVELVNRFVSSLLFLSSLSLLGIGVQPPASDWGSLIKLNASGLLLGSPAPLIPGAFILMAALLAVSLFAGRFRAKFRFTKENLT
jgi:peptide/nickel transport system permease protein